MNAALDNVVVVLFEPQDDINIGNTVRACKNFGVRRIRLVNPASADPRRISISAPRAADVIDALERFDSLEAALADCTLVVGTTARQRHNKRLYLEPRGAAAEIAEAAAGGGTCAILFGREDSGLPNEALDHCHATVTIPTNPDYSSLNLGQAVLLLIWEVFRAATDQPITRPEADLVRADSEHPPADHEAVERMFQHAERVLDDVGFLKESSREHMVSVFREMLLRSGLDTREVAIWHGIFSQVEWAVSHKPRD